MRFAEGAAGAAWTAPQVVSLVATIATGVVAALAILVGVWIARSERDHRDLSHFRDVRREAYIGFLRSFDHLKVQVGRHAREKPRRESVEELQAAMTVLFLVAPKPISSAVRELWDAADEWFRAPSRKRVQAGEEMDLRLREVRVLMTRDIAPANLEDYLGLLSGTNRVETTGTGAPITR